MKLKLAVSDESYEEVSRFLTGHGIELDDEADLILTQRDKYVSHISARDPKTGEKLHLSVDELVYIETYGHLVELHTGAETFHTADRLYQLAAMLDPERFLRISNSVIISKRRVSRIDPAFSMKFVLVMSNGDKVDVTRSYYNIFKEAFKI